MHIQYTVYRHMPDCSPEEAYRVSFNDELYMRVLTGVVVDDLRWKRWDMMISNTFVLAAQHCQSP